MFQTKDYAVVINSKLADFSNAMVPIFDRGFLFGHAVFETILFSNETLVEWESHYNRLFSACQKIKLKCPNELNLRHDCEIGIKKCIDSNSGSLFVSVKIIVTGGNHNELYLSSPQNSNIYIICKPITQMSFELRMQGFCVKSFLDKRGSFAIGLKTTNYLYAFLCWDAAKHKGYNEAVFYNRKGEITEGPTANFIWFDDTYTIYSAPLKGNCLPGISLLKLKRELASTSYSFAYKALNKNNTTKCVGCALISSVRGLVPIKKLDKTTFDVEQHSSFFKFLIRILSS